MAFTVDDLSDNLLEKLRSYDIEPEDFVNQLNGVESKRGQIVIKQILSKGWVSTRELREDYGYEHAPRA